MISKTVAYKLLFISTLLILSFGTAAVVGQTVVKENPIANQSNSQVITQVVLKNISAAGADEYIVVYNAGDDTNLMNWNVTVNNTTNYALPYFNLLSLDSVNIHFGKGTTNLTDIYLNKSPNVLNDKHGDVKLVDDAGNMLSDVTY